MRTIPYLPALAIALINSGCTATRVEGRGAGSPDEGTRSVAVGLASQARIYHGSITNSAQLDQTDQFWKRAEEEIYRSPEELVAQDARETRRGEKLPKLMRGNPNKKLLALTFDDGPHQIYTNLLLNILQREQVKATFFVIGKMVERYPNLLRSIDAAGMDIGNHTFSHVTLTKIPEQDAEIEYRANNDIVKKVIGKTMRFCRPPGGDYDAEVIEASTHCGLTTVLWTDDPGDYANPGQAKIEERVLSKITNGGIILLHDGVAETLNVLPQIIAYGKKKGFQFVTISELQRSINAN